MPRGSGGINEDVKDITWRVLGELGLDRAAEKLDFKLTRTPIADLKRGKVGREATIRTFAEGFWERFCEEYGHQICERFGQCNREAVSDWFAEKAGFGLRHQHPATEQGSRVGERAPLTYEPNLDEIDIAGWAGASSIPPEDISILNAIIRGFLAERRRQKGLEVSEPDER